MADSPQLPDEIDPRGRWLGVGSRTSARRLRDGETPASEAAPEAQDDEGTTAYVLPTYRSYTRGEQRNALRISAASWGGYYADPPQTKIADEGLQLPINEDGYVFDGTEKAIGAAGQYPAQVGRAPTKPYAGQPPSSITITRNLANQSTNDPRGAAPTGAADMAAWLMQGDF